MLFEACHVRICRPGHDLQPHLANGGWDSRVAHANGIQHRELGRIVGTAASTT